MSLVIYEQPRLVFIHIPKSGGTSITLALRQAALQQGWREIVHEFYTHISLSKLSAAMAQAQDGASPLSLAALSPEWLETARIFAMIRNPWARMVSLYSFRLERALARIEQRSLCKQVKKSDPVQDLAIVAEMRQLGFSRWLQSTRLQEALYGVPLTQKSQLSWCRDASGNLGRCKLLRLESPDTQFLASVGVSILPRVNRSGVNGAYQACYDGDAQRFVAHHFAEDIEWGGYVF